jgi:hypothetical protein
MRCLADGAFILALSGNNKAVAASTGQPDGYARRHENVEAAGVATGACQVAAAARDGPADGSKRLAVDRTDGNARRHKSVEAAREHAEWPPQPGMDRPPARNPWQETG